MLQCWSVEALVERWRRSCVESHLESVEKSILVFHALTEGERVAQAQDAIGVRWFLGVDFCPAQAQRVDARWHAVVRVEVTPWVAGEDDFKVGMRDIFAHGDA